MQLKRTLIGSAALAAMLAMGGCGFFSTPDTHEPNELTDFTPRVEARVEWSTDVGEAAAANLAPVVTDTAVYAAGGNELVRLDRQTGDVVWRSETDGQVTAGVGTDGSTIAVGTDRGEVQVFDAEGREVWKAVLSSDVETPPIVGAGRVIVRPSDPRLTGFDAITGERLWHYQGQAPALTLRNFSQMSWAPAGVLIGQSNGRLLALNPLDGRVVFDAVIGQAKGITEVERLIDVVGRPWVDQEMMCAATFQGGLVCMNSMNGRLLWSAKIDAVTGPVADSRLVYIVDAEGRVHAFNRENGREAWVNSDLLYRRPSAPIRIGATVAVADFEGYVTMFNPATGEIVGRTSLDSAVTTPASQYGYGAVFQTVDGEVAYVVQEQLAE